TPEVLGSPLLRLIQALSPCFVKVFKERFTSKHIAKKLGIDKREFAKLAQPLNWNEGLLGASALKHYTTSMAKQRFQVYNLPGLRHEVFYDGRYRAFFIDEKFYASLPNSIVFHRVY